MGGLFDLEGQLAFYGSYHSNLTNILIHVVGVPCILFSAMLLISSYSPPLVAGSLNTVAPALSAYLPPFAQTAKFDVTFFLAVIYGLYYISLEKRIGSVVAALGLIAFWIFANFFVQSQPKNIVVQYAVALHVLSWIAQFIGHGVFEGRKPALLDNLVQSLVLAPLFVWLEILFVFGYRPDLQKRVEARIATEIQKWKSQNQSSNKKAK